MKTDPPDSRPPTPDWNSPRGWGLVCLLILVFQTACAKDAPPASQEASPSSPPSADTVGPMRGRASDSMLIATAPPPFSEGIFPCSRCHAKMLTNPTRRTMRWAHEEIVLNHDEGNRWCLDCHSALNRDFLHLANGELVPFTESYRLCGQCHGPSLRNWRAGEHGKRTGSWSGAKQYRLCASCHNPHSPRFAPLKPLPPPVRPADLFNKGETHV